MGGIVLSVSLVCPYSEIVMAYMLAYRNAGVTYSRYLAILNRATTACLKEPLKSSQKEAVTYYDYINLTWDDLGQKAEERVFNYSKEDMNEVAKRVNELKVKQKAAEKAAKEKKN